MTFFFFFYLSTNRTIFGVADDEILSDRICLDRRMNQIEPHVVQFVQLK